VAKALVTPKRLPNPALVGKSAEIIAQACGLSVPAGTRVLIAPLEGVGRDYPLSIEKLCPVLSFYVVNDWREGCERCKEILRYGGMGHTMSIHSQNEQVILEFGLKKPAFRIIVNSPTTHGSIGLTTGLDPAMTLGCGGYGGNITSDNITPRHLLNIKRLAYELVPAEAATRPSTPRPAPRPGIQAEVLTRRIDQFLGARGYAPAGMASAPVAEAPAEAAPSGAALPKHPASATAAAPPPPPVTAPDPSPAPAEPQEALTFVCEADVRQAIQTGRRLVVAEKGIVTPSARDLGEAHKVLEFR
jgi:acetaldehyde dehydrogenase (acetylating)